MNRSFCSSTSSSPAARTSSPSTVNVPHQNGYNRITILARVEVVATSTTTSYYSSSRVESTFV